MTREEIIEEVSYSTDISIEKVSKYSNYKLFAKWLQSNGIIGYANDIIDVIEIIFNIKLKENGET